MIATIIAFMVLLNPFALFIYLQPPIPKQGRRAGSSANDGCLDVPLHAVDKCIAASFPSRYARSSEKISLTMLPWYEQNHIDIHCSYMLKIS
jgi:hypothetical protein